MSLKMNFLIITSIIVLTIFVKMVPAPEKDQTNSEAMQTPPGGTVSRNNSADMKLPERNSIHIGMFNKERKKEYENKHIASCEELYEFYDMNINEIINYSEKIGIIETIDCEKIKKSIDMNPSDIVEYCKIMRPPDIAATILYIEDTLIRYNTYNPDISLGSNVFINYSLMKNNDYDSELMKEIEEFKNIKEKDLRGLFQAVTSCYLGDYKNNKILIPSSTLHYPENAKTFEDTFFLNQFRFFYNLSNAEISVIGDEFHVSVEELLNIVQNDETNIKNDVTYLDKYHLNELKSETYLLFLKAYIKELHSHDPISFDSDTLSSEAIVKMMDRFNDKKYQRTVSFSVKKYLVDEFIQFTSIWQFYRFDINLYLKYKIIDASTPFGSLFNYDEPTLDVVDGEKLTALEAFKKYFKESLDDSYNIVLNMNINDLDDSKKNIYYKRTLMTLKNIFQAHFSETETESIAKFVQRMVYVADAILKSEKTKQIPIKLKEKYILYNDVCPKPQKPESDQKSESPKPKPDHKSEINLEHKPSFRDDNDIKTTIKNNYYTCDSTRCGLPDIVNCKDVLNYMIAHYNKEIHDFIIEKVI